MDKSDELLHRLQFLQDELVTVTMCGDIKYEEDMRELAALLEIRVGWNILLPIDIYKLTGYNPRLEKKSMYTLKKIHYYKILNSNAILVYVDQNREFADSKNVLDEIVVAAKCGKDIYFSQLLESTTTNKISNVLKAYDDQFGNKFEVVCYKYIDIDKFRFYQLHYKVIH